MQQLTQIIHDVKPPKYRLEYLYECAECGATCIVKAKEYKAIGVRCPFCTFHLMNRVGFKKIKLTKAERKNEMKNLTKDCAG